MVSALVSMRDCAWETSAPNSARNLSGSTLARRSWMADISAALRSCSSSVGPTIVDRVAASRNLISGKFQLLS